MKTTTSITCSRPLKHCVVGAIFFVFPAIVGYAASTDTIEPPPRDARSTHSLPPSSLDFQKLIPKEFNKAWKFQMDDWMIWGADVVMTKDGTCHMFFSYWPKSAGFESWVTHSRIGYATAEQPEGPYTYQRPALPFQHGDVWDSVSHNPSIIEHGGKFYLYYTGTHGAGHWEPGKPIADRVERWKYRMNMRVGVAVAEHPSGPWTRFDKPLLNVGDYGDGIVATPCAMVSPHGDVFLYYKTQLPGKGRFGGGVMHYASTSKSPLGPFEKHSRPIIDKRDYFPKRSFTFHIDDHEEWFQDDRYYAIVKDHDKPFLTEHGQVLHLLESKNGLDWIRSKNSFVKDQTIRWSDGTTIAYRRLEMPKIFLENGKPRVLFLAGQEANSPSLASYNIAVPLGRQRWDSEQRANKADAGDGK